MPIHVRAEQGDYAEACLLPGDPLRATYIAETYLEMDRDEDARRELRLVLDAPLDPEWVPETNEFKAKAAALLKKLDTRR